MCIPCKPMRCRRTVDLGRQRRRLTRRFRMKMVVVHATRCASVADQTPGSITTNSYRQDIGDICPRPRSHRYKGTSYEVASAV